MERKEQSRVSNGHTAPVRLIVETICLAIMFYSGQTLRDKKGSSSDGCLKEYWSQHITERQWYKWKPRVLAHLRQQLQIYSPS